MAKKKKYHLKKSAKVFLIILVLLGIASYFGYQRYQEYLYTKTQEYALLQLGYNEEQVKILKDNLNEEQISKVLTYEYNEFIPEFITKPYFMFKNLDGYLSQVITKDQDFFKYHGTDGYDYGKIIQSVNVHTINDFYEETHDTNLDDGYAILVNKYYKLDSSYIPDDLVSIPWKYRLGGENDQKQVRKEVYDAYLAMWESAYSEGIYLLVDSGFRTYKSQQEVYDMYAQRGIKYADSIAARPGFSEHQTGLSLDIYSKECASASKFKDSKTYAWLIQNAHKFGFILRYPENKEDITGYNYESWHYRYLGVELATKVYESGLTYDEYYAYYIEK